jgi:hypothetical protein
MRYLSESGVVATCLIVLVILFAASPTLSASSPSATVSFSYTASSLLVSVVSSVGVSGWRVEVDIPLGVSIGSASGSGFMADPGSPLPNPPDKYVWFNLGANGQTTGSLTIPVTYSGPYTITLAVVDLNQPPISINPPLPINLVIGQPSAITLTPSPTSQSLGHPITITGAIAPTHSVTTTVALSYSLDHGITWAIFITTQTSNLGSYSVAWFPPYPVNYQLRASWGGDSNCSNCYASATSTVTSLSVTGTRPAQLSLLATGPTSAVLGGAATFDVLVTNPGLVTPVTVYMEILGPRGYAHWDTMQTSAASGLTHLQFQWQIPSTAAKGNYQVNMGLIPPTSTSVSQTQISVT